jgi:hypothetical protein
VSRSGICLPATTLSGSACRTARIVHDRDPHRDRLIQVMSLSCSAGSVCEIPDVGFPGGMCARSDCGRLQAGEACGSIAILQGFNACLAARRPFAECLRNNVRPAVLKGCDANEPCRDDYICARTAAGHNASKDARERADNASEDARERAHGACIPPYFLFQLRVDGHPAP